MAMCPVCNGLTTIQQPCPSCSTLMADQGKMSDFYGPYSPYREIDHLNMSIGYVDVQQQEQCLHYVYCPGCKQELLYPVEKNTYKNP